MELSRDFPPHKYLKGTTFKTLQGHQPRILAGVLVKVLQEEKFYLPNFFFILIYRSIVEGVFNLEGLMHFKSHFCPKGNF